MEYLDYLVECNFTEATDTLDKNYVAHAKYEMFLLLHGDVTILINSRKYHLQDGSLVLLTPRDLHLTMNNTSETYRRITMHFDPKVVQMFNTNNTNLLSCFHQASAAQRNIIQLDEEQVHEYVRLASSIAPYWGSRIFGDDLTALSSLVLLLVYVNRAFLTQRIAVPVPCSPLVIQIADYVDENLGQNLSVATLAEQFSYSQSYISTLFSKQMGVSLKYFIITKRIAYAKQLLLVADNSVMSVCEQCGFNDYCNFIRSFKQIVGITPLRWKQEAWAKAPRNDETGEGVMALGI
ncbi:MAG: AraC family transcriptional regulator [Eubacteriales bacterium]|nr:AraC family transcriptional regulator [Eubacteriales bacterium]